MYLYMHEYINSISRCTCLYICVVLKKSKPSYNKMVFNEMQMIQHHLAKMNGWGDSISTASDLGYAWFETHSENIMRLLQIFLVQTNIKFTLQLATEAGSNKYYIFSVCVCSLSYLACKAHVPYYIVICGLPGPTKFFFVISQTA